MSSKDYDNVLVDDRIIYIFGDITALVVNQTIKYMVRMSKDDPEEDITLVVNSDGGYTSAGLQLIDMMNSIRPDICVVAMGSCSSAAADIVAQGAVGKRYAAPNVWFMIHEASMSSTSERVSDMEIDTKFLDDLNKQMAKLLAKATGQPLRKILKDTRRDYYLSAKEAKEYGIVDKVGIPDCLT